MTDLSIKFYDQVHFSLNTWYGGIMFFTDYILNYTEDESSIDVTTSFDDEMLWQRWRIIDPYQYRLNDNIDPWTHARNAVNVEYGVKKTKKGFFTRHKRDTSGSATLLKIDIAPIFYGRIFSETERLALIKTHAGSSQYVEIPAGCCVNKQRTRSIINLTRNDNHVRSGDIIAMVGVGYAGVFGGVEKYVFNLEFYGRVTAVKDNYITYVTGALSPYDGYIPVSEGSYPSEHVFEATKFIRLQLSRAFVQASDWDTSRTQYVGTYTVAYKQYNATPERCIPHISNLRGIVNAAYRTYSTRVAHGSASYLNGYFIDQTDDPEYYWDVQSALYKALEGTKDFPGLSYTTDNSWQNVLAAVGVAASWVTSGSFSVPESWKGTWLEYRYVMGTGMMDLNAYCSHVATLVERFYNPWVFHRATVTTRQGHRLTVSFAARDATLAGFQRMAKTARATGFWPSWYQAWDFVPYSFIVDWFVPIGSLLEREARSQYYTDRNFEFTPLFWISEKWQEEVNGWHLSFLVRDACSDYSLEQYAFWEHYQPSNKTIVKRTIDTLALGSSIKRLLTPKPQIMHHEVQGLRDIIMRTPYA